jgi:hypothetical protein
VINRKNGRENKKISNWKLGGMKEFCHKKRKVKFRLNEAFLKYNKKEINKEGMTSIINIEEKQMKLNRGSYHRSQGD